MSFWDYSLESTGRTQIVSIQYQEPYGRAKNPVFMRVCAVLSVIPTLSKEFIRRCFWCFSASFMAKIPPHFTHISIQTGFVYLLCTSKSLVFLLSLFADTPKTAQHYCPYYSTSRCFRQILFSMQEVFIFSMQEVSYVRVST